MASAGLVPGRSAPAASMAGVTRSDAATGAAAPSRAQLSPPKAIMLVPTATWANTTTRSSSSRPPAAASASAQKTTRLAPPTSSGAHQANPARTTAAARPPTSSTSPAAMKSIEIDSGGPVMPRSKSRAAVRSRLSAGSSRWPMPAGRRQASVSRSYSQAAVRSPRLVPIAWWRGVSTWSSTNTTPTAASGPASSPPRCTAPTSAPVATANPAGSSPRPTSTAHQATASPGSARYSTPKNRHSWRSRSRVIKRSAHPDHDRRRRPRGSAGPTSRARPVVGHSLACRPPPRQGEGPPPGTAAAAAASNQTTVTRPTRRPDARSSLAGRRRPGPGRRGRGRPGGRLVGRFAGQGRGSADGGGDHAPLPLRALGGPGRAGGAGPVRAPQHRPDRPRVHPRRPRRPAPPRAGPRAPAPRRRPRRALGRRRPGGRHHLRLPAHPGRPGPRVRLPPPRPLRLRHARHRPGRLTRIGDRIGWLLCGLALWGATAELEEAYGHVAAERGLPGGVAGEWLISWSWIVDVAAWVVVVLSFPDGRLPGRRWRLAIWVSLAGAVLLFVGQALTTETTDFSGGGNPLGVDSPLVDAAWPVGTALLVAGLVAAVAACVPRYRRARGVERQQLKWFASAGLILALVMPLSAVLWYRSVLVQILAAVSLNAMPLAIG